MTVHDGALEESGGLPGNQRRRCIAQCLGSTHKNRRGEVSIFTLFEKVAALGFLLARNHPFSDANKRTSLLLMSQTLKWNAHYPKWSAKTRIMVMNLLGAGHLETTGLRHALLLDCGLDVADPDL